MKEPLAYYNGSLIAESSLRIPVYDAGFVLGTTVTEQIRTFSGKLFRLQSHLDRLRHSLQILSLDEKVNVQHLGEVAEKLVAHNHPLLPEGHDLGLAIFVTPGAFATLAPADLDRNGPTVGLHTYPLPFHLWAEKYEQGEELTTTEVQQVPPTCWPVELKCRSRMHYYLADKKAAEITPGSRALLLDDQGFVCEASTANVVSYFADQGLIVPPVEKILPGISMAELIHLADQLKIPVSHCDLTAEQLATADEILLCSTSSCVTPVVRLNGQPIGAEKPGPVFKELISSWSKNVGLDIIKQAQNFSNVKIGDG